MTCTCSFASVYADHMARGASVLNKELMITFAD